MYNGAGYNNLDEPVVTNELTSGIGDGSPVLWPDSGVAVGGEALFQHNVATLWG